MVKNILIILFIVFSISCKPQATIEKIEVLRDSLIFIEPKIPIHEFVFNTKDSFIYESERFDVKLKPNLQDSTIKVILIEKPFFDTIQVKETIYKEKIVYNENTIYKTKFKNIRKVLFLSVGLNALLWYMLIVLIKKKGL